MASMGLTMVAIGAGWVLFWLTRPRCSEIRNSGHTSDIEGGRFDPSNLPPVGFDEENPGCSSKRTCANLESVAPNTGRPKKTNLRAKHDRKRGCGVPGKASAKAEGKEKNRAVDKKKNCCRPNSFIPSPLPILEHTSVPLLKKFEFKVKKLIPRGGAHEACAGILVKKKKGKR